MVKFEVPLPSSLVLYVCNLADYRSTYYVRIEASDAASPRLSSSVLVTVRVTDRNDNKPTFTRSNYTVSSYLSYFLFCDHLSSV